MHASIKRSADVTTEVLYNFYFFLFKLFLSSSAPRKKRTGKKESATAARRRERIENLGKFKSKAFLSSSDSDSDDGKLKIAEAR